MEKKPGHSSSNTQLDNLTDEEPEYENDRKRTAILDAKKKVSSLESFVKKSALNIDTAEQRPKRGSFILGKFTTLEKELTFDKIQSRVQHIFQPYEPKRSKDDASDESDLPPPNQLSAGQAATFIISGTTGSGLSTLPYALKKSSWFGVFLLLLLGINALYGALCIAWSWNLMEEKWPEYKAYRRVPYQDIAHRAVGIWMKHIVGILIDISQIGACCVYALTIAFEIEKLSNGYYVFCWTLLVTMFVITPFTGFSYYRNMKFVAVLDAFLSLAFATLLIIGVILDRGEHEKYTYTDPSYNSVMLSFATFAFAYGSGPIIPSVMTDSKYRGMFPHACGTAYLKFCWTRIFIRLVIMLFMLLLVLGVPFLDKFVQFVGATTMNLLTFVLPPIFYICLLHQRVSLFSKKSSVTKKEWLMLAEMILLGIIVGVISTYVSIETYMESPPTRQACYYNMSS